VAGANGYFAPIAGAKYIQLTTYRRDGRPVPTPVHVTVADGEAFFRTWDASGKAKRIRHTQTVTIAPSSARGRPRGEPIRARATLLSGPESDRAARLIARKHPILHGWLIPRLHRRRGWTTQQYRLTPVETRTPS
jgi:PPOX class probable F420-dependent enzyme